MIKTKLLRQIQGNGRIKESTNLVPLIPKPCIKWHPYYNHFFCQGMQPALLIWLKIKVLLGPGLLGWVGLYINPALSIHIYIYIWERYWCYFLKQGSFKICDGHIPFSYPLFHSTFHRLLFSLYSIHFIINTILIIDYL